MNRRNFNRTLALAAPVLCASRLAASSKVYPKRLQAGDTIGLITPGSYLSDEGLQKAVDQIVGLGFRIKMGKNIRAERGFNAGTDQQRLDDLHMMFTDRSVDAIWCARGGYGCSRLLPYIDYTLIAKNPKLLIGYSDITALLNAIYYKTGLVGLHGPVGASDFTDYTMKHLRPLLTGEAKSLAIALSSSHLEEPDPAYHPITIRAGQATGTLVGGNLSLLAAMAGTGYLPNVKGKLVFIEEIGEKPYRVDRMLTQLRQAWPLEQAAGLAMGIFADCEAPADALSLSLLETVRDRTADLKIPVVYGLPFGHVSDQCALPVGTQARLDADSYQLTLLESPVR